MAGLRERKKQETYQSLCEAALRLALEHGPDNVRVDDIADAAGVSPRTYNNYFSSREQAIVAAVTADRESHIAAAVVAHPPRAPLSEAVTEAVVAHYATPPDPKALLLITTNPTLREAYLNTTTALENPLATAIAHRTGAASLVAEVLAASIAAAVRITLNHWAAPTHTGLVTVSGSLPDLLHTGLAPLAPALDALAN